MTMLEKAVRACAIAELGDKDMSAVDLFAPRFEKHVRAVLLAIREPDEAMVAAPIAGKLSVDFSPTFVWHAMIDTLLKEQP